MFFTCRTLICPMFYMRVRGPGLIYSEIVYIKIITLVMPKYKVSDVAEALAECSMVYRG